MPGRRDAAPAPRAHGRGQAGQAPALEDAAPLPLRGAAPDPVVDAVHQGVLEALALDGAGRADAPCDLDAHAVAGEEDGRVAVRTVAARHPFGAHRSSSSAVARLGGRPQAPTVFDGTNGWSVTRPTPGGHGGFPGDPPTGPRAARTPGRGTRGVRGSDRLSDRRARRVSMGQ